MFAFDMSVEASLKHGGTSTLLFLYYTPPPDLITLALVYGP